MHITQMLPTQMLPTKHYILVKLLLFYWQRLSKRKRTRHLTCGSLLLASCLSPKSENDKAANYPFCTIEPNTGVVPVAYDRLDKLAQNGNSNKNFPAFIEFVEIAF